MKTANAHIENIRENLALLADFGFASIILAVPEPATAPGGTPGGAPDATPALRVVATHRSTTAVAPLVSQLDDTLLDRAEHATAYAAAQSATTVRAEQPREYRGVTYVVQAHPVTARIADGSIHAGEQDLCTASGPIAVIIRHIAAAAVDNPGRMEGEFFAMATEITEMLCTRPLLTVDGELFSTTRRPGDGVLRVAADGTVVYPSPNAVAIMRRAGFEERVRTSPAGTLPGGGYGVTPVLGTYRALERETEVLGRSLLYRSIGMGAAGAVVFVEDVTELRRQQAELAGRDRIITEIRDQVRSLSEQLETRKCLDRAKAILMERGLSEAQAFSKLQKTAMDFRKPLKEVCEAIILSDEMK
ncbi:MAG: histidine kinase N-terminal domain-containing protein [Actinomycetes bacterium]|jgi:hypothetical protein|nr:histidine kinase N-terminal domain-containing protein [Actinomycetes bacterium]